MIYFPKLSFLRAIVIFVTYLLTYNMSNKKINYFSGYLSHSCFTVIFIFVIYEVLCKQFVLMSNWPFYHSKWYKVDHLYIEFVNLSRYFYMIINYVLFKLFWSIGFISWMSLYCYINRMQRSRLWHLTTFYIRLREYFL